MSEWHTEELDLPDFTVHGFHMGKTLDYRLSDGQELNGIYQGYGLFGAKPMYDWMAGDPHVVAWRIPAGDRK